VQDTSIMLNIAHKELEESWWLVGVRVLIVMAIGWHSGAVYPCNWLRTRSPHFKVFLFHLLRLLTLSNKCLLASEWEGARFRTPELSELRVLLYLEAISLIPTLQKALTLLKEHIIKMQ